MTGTLTDEEREKRKAEELWLDYLNRYLLDHNVITQREFNLIAAKLATRRSNQRLKQDSVS